MYDCSFSKKLVLFSIAVFLTLFQFATVAHSAPKRVMPVGDSITTGMCSTYYTGYRQKLYLSLIDLGYDIEFVGSMSHGQFAPTFFDYDHEGRPGWTADDISQDIFDWLIAYTPDIVLLHIGTNGFGPASDVAKILDEIDRYSPDVEVILARIINVKDTSDPDAIANITAFNQALQLMADARITAGDKIQVVDMEPALDYSAHFPCDELHPNEDGYESMSDVWEPVLKSMLPTPGLSAPLFVDDIPDAQVIKDNYFSFDCNTFGNPSREYSLTTSPAGMTIDLNSGLIEWTPTATGTFDVTVVATNTQGTDNQSFSIEVVDTPSFPTGVVSYWKFDELRDPVYFDANFIANGRCTDNCPVPTTGKLNGGQAFDGNTEVGVFPATEYDVDVGESFSVEYLMYKNTPAFSNEPIIGRDDDFSSVTWWSGVSDTVGGEAIFYLQDRDGNGFAVTGTTPLIDGTWHHVVSVYDDTASELRIYVDGKLEGKTPTSYTSDFIAPNAMLTIGWHGSGFSFEGSVDEIVFHNQALNQEEIGAHYVNVSDGKGYFEANNSAPVIFSTAVTTGYNGTPYTYDVDSLASPAAGYSLTTFPPGMTIGTSTGLIQWTPSSVGTFSVVVVATNTAGTDNQSFDINVVTPSPPNITSTAVTTGTVNTLYQYDVEATGGPAPTYSLTTPPAGMTINTTTGLIQWTPTSAGLFPVTVVATNTEGTDTQSFSINVTEPPQITSTAVVAGAKDVLYQYDVDASGTPAPTFSLTTSPPGMTINPTSGLIQWTPTSVGKFSVVVVATNTAGTNNQSFDIDVVNTSPPNITTTAVVVGVKDTLYQYDVDASGAPAPTYSLTTPPAGMTINTASGMIQWTPTSVGTFPVTVVATNAVGTDSQSFNIDVVATTSPPNITSTAVTTGTVNTLYQYDVESSGAPAPTYTLTTKPAGMTINSTTGQIEWTPTSAGTFSVVVVATNTAGTDNQSFDIIVGGAGSSFPWSMYFPAIMGSHLN